MLYAYNILSFYFTNTDTLDKTDIANKIADNKAVLILPNGSDKDGKTPIFEMALGQNLNKNKIANVGSKWYMAMIILIEMQLSKKSFIWFMIMV